MSQIDEARPRPCPLCDEEIQLAAELALVSPDDGLPYRTVRCAACSLVYTDPIPELESLEKLYPEAYYPADQTGRGIGVVLKNLLQNRVQAFHRRILGVQKPGRVLDVGCGAGDFLSDLKDRGWQVQGTDFSHAALERTAEKRIESQYGSVHDCQFEDDSFDLVTAWHVVEHLPDPRTELLAIHRVLKAGGSVVIEVPNIASVGYMLFKQHWFQLDVPRHLQHFTLETLERLLLSCGFECRQRWQFHLWDPTSFFYSMMNWLGVSRRLSIDVATRGFRDASVLAKVAYVTVATVVAPLSVGAVVFFWLVTGHSESVTIAARKLATARPAVEAL